MQSNLANQNIFHNYLIEMLLNILHLNCIDVMYERLNDVTSKKALGDSKVSN